MNQYGQSAEIREPAMLIRPRVLFREGMSREELYDITRGRWVVGPRRESAEYAMAVHMGVVKEVYSIESWEPAGTRPSAVHTEPAPPGRWEFVGRPAPDWIRDAYVGRSVAHYFSQGNQNPIKYVNC